MKDLIECKRLAESALVCLRDAIERHNRAKLAIKDTPKAKGLSGVADDAAMSAAWRLADAGLLLRRHLALRGLQCCGMTEPTGRGALLPGAPATRQPVTFNCLPEGDTLADTVARDDITGFDVRFCKSDATDPDDRSTVTCLPGEAEFATIYGATDLGECIALHDVDLTNAGADSLADACRAAFAAIISASRVTEIN